MLNPCSRRYASTRSLKPERQTSTTLSATCSGETKRKLSSCPANEHALPSSSRAEERTATDSPAGQSVATARPISRRIRASSCTLARMVSMVNRSDPAQASSKAERCASVRLALKAAGETTNHAGIGIFAVGSAASALALPPYSQLAPVVPGCIITATCSISCIDSIALDSFRDQLPDERQNAQAQIDQQGPCASKRFNPFAATREWAAQEAYGNPRRDQQQRAEE